MSSYLEKREREELKELREVAARFSLENPAGKTKFVIVYKAYGNETTETHIIRMNITTNKMINSFFFINRTVIHALVSSPPSRMRCLCGLLTHNGEEHFKRKYESEIEEIG